MSYKSTRFYRFMMSNAMRLLHFFRKYLVFSKTDRYNKAQIMTTNISDPSIFSPQDFTISWPEGGQTISSLVGIEITKNSII